MKLLKKILIAAAIMLLLFVGLKKYKPTLEAVYPQQCAFLIDKQFSAPFQSALQAYVSQKYQSSKDVKQILEDVSGKFCEIGTMDAYVCKTDHLCFTFDAAKPLFVLNDAVVCSNLQLTQKEHYQPAILDGLVTVLASGSSDVAKIATFVAGVPPAIFQDFDVRWDGDDAITLTQKIKNPDILLFSVQRKPTLNEIALFKQIQQSKKKNKKQTYDFRFNNQIIVK